MVGILELIIGPMYAGKSTELIRITNIYRNIGKTVLGINHTLNTRFDTTDITTHDKKVLEGCIVVEKLEDIEHYYTDELLSSEIIIIDELQFFPDAYATILRWVEDMHKTVITAGLDGDFNREPFGDVLRLIPIADKVTKLSAMCKQCGTPAFFSKRIIDSVERTIVGSTEVYEAVCRRHYLEKDKKSYSPLPVTFC